MAIQVMTMARLSFVLDSVLSCVEKSVCPKRTRHTPPEQASTTSRRERPPPTPRVTHRRSRRHLVHITSVTQKG